MPVKLLTASSGSVTLDAANTASNFTISVPATTATMAINGPAFSYFQSSNQTLSSNTLTKLTFTTSNYDTTSGMYASSRFTPTIAGYYLISTGVGLGVVATGVQMILYKNGSAYQSVMNQISGTLNAGNGTTIVYLNGSTDYVEIYAQFTAGQTTFANSQFTYFQAVMVRAA